MSPQSLCPFPAAELQGILNKYSKVKGGSNVFDKYIFKHPIDNMKNPWNFRIEKMYQF